jgi:hypothetical protein
MTGSPPNQTLVCADPNGAPVCAPTASPLAPAKGQTVTISANCSHQPTSYAWTGGDCAGTTGPTCAMTRTRRAKVQLSLRATNASGTGPIATITVQWH